jgi:hypothetical protein
MPMLDQLLHKEVDPFQKSEEQTSKDEHGVLSVGQQRRAEETRLLQEERTAMAQIAPSVVADLPQQSPASQEAVQRLYSHFTEQKSTAKSEDQKDPDQTTPAEPKHGQKFKPLKGKNQRRPGDQVKEGVGADFVRDSAIVAGEMDTHPDQDGSVWDGPGDGGRRKRRGSSGRASSAKAKKPESKG